MLKHPENRSLAVAAHHRAASVRILLVASVSVISCGRSGLPATDSKQYREFVSAFYVGLSGLQTGEDVRAKQRLTEATKLAPGEPAAWADLALFSVRTQDFDLAYEYAEKARVLAPENSRVEELLGSIEAKRSKLPESIAHLRKAVQLDSGNLKAHYALAEQLERQGTPEADREAQTALESILQKQPANIPAQVEILRLASKRSDKAAIARVIRDLTAESSRWPEEVRQRLTTAVEAANGPNPRAAAVQATFLRNVLARVPEYRRTLDAVKTPAIFVGDPFTRFLRLPNLDSRPAPADPALTFTAEELKVNGTGPVTWAGALALDGSGKRSLATKQGNSLFLEGGAQLPFPGAAKSSRHAIAAADLNYDFKTDLAIATDAGVRIFLQQNPSQWEEITTRSRLPATVLNGSYTGAWAFDFDLDGDLDIVLGTASGEPVVLRNNADSTFAVARPFRNVDGLLSFAAADFDGDGDPDIAIVDARGVVHVFTNERLGEFVERRPSQMEGATSVALASADVDGDGLADFVVLRQDGAVDLLSAPEDGSGLNIKRLIQAAGSRLDPARANFLVEDFDNNGALDILAGDGRFFLQDGRGFSERSVLKGFKIWDAADSNGDGKLDLLAVSFAGGAVTAINRGSKAYAWQDLRFRAAETHGDQRINSFGIGGEVEIRSGLLAQKQIITGPVLHFGLGTQTQTDVARIRWPNGAMQSEFELKPNQSIFAEQRLKGSCPSLFSWDGKQVTFVKDSPPWSPALGLHINAQDVAGITQTEEWFKLPGEAVQPHNGHYDLRVTGELWETFYIDHYELRAVDHPKGTEIYTDERFSLDPPPLKVFTLTEPRPFASAVDDRGTDVSAIVRDSDSKHLGSFGRGRYQGVTRDHWVELELPADAPRGEPLYLIGSGWLHPTDATVNIALSQNSEAPPQSLRIEVPDKLGNWVVVRRNLGFLAGKQKTAVLRIDDLFVSGASRKLRLGTNMEIYWDQLSWAVSLHGVRTKMTILPMTRAELRYRGFSVMNKADASSPELPDYNHVQSRVPRWHDLEGYYTRYGDVRELLQSADDRFVIQNAGDEIALEFETLPPPPSGWKRDFVMVGNGWIKDGDYNSVFSKTVLPLPYRAIKDYRMPPSTLEKDFAYRLHPGDWDIFHTRYITPDRFIRALRE